VDTLRGEIVECADVLVNADVDTLYGKINY
jgi:hypothetical protein